MEGVSFMKRESDSVPPVSRAPAARDARGIVIALGPLGSSDDPEIQFGMMEVKVLEGHGGHVCSQLGVKVPWITGDVLRLNPHA